MKLKKIINQLNEWAPPVLAEDFDNVGLLIGDKRQDINKILVAFDITPEVIEEAKEENANLIVSFHPLIFKGLKKIVANDRTSAMVLDIIKNNIAVYALHTNLDSLDAGPNAEICKQLGIINSKVLIPKTDSLYKLVFFVPNDFEDEVKDSIFKEGAGHIGNYSHCSFSHQGKGSFKAEQGANPTLGELNKIHLEDEKRVEVILPSYKLSNILNALKTAHPYEEVAYDIFKLENKNKTKGMGRIGDLEKPLKGMEFLAHLKNTFNLKYLRHSSLVPKEIKRVAVLGGSGAFAIEAAKAQGADAFVSADFKYHDFFKGLKNFMLCDVGHYESEQWNKTLIKNYLSEKFPNFAIRISRINTNSVNYY